jgi:hypothetical protein
MKYKEQKQLELLYEQIVSNEGTFNLLPEEEKYFENVIDFYFNRFNTNPRIREFMKGGPSSTALVTMLNGYERPAPFSQFCKKSLGFKEKAINSFYNTNVLGFTESFIRLTRVKAKGNKKVLAFEFLRLDKADSNRKRIPVTEVQTVRENLKECLINALANFVKPTHGIKLGDEQVWFGWREERVKVTELEDRLQEIEGIF